ncbi:MAG: ornithine cyclodeaminase family protein [Halodesulfurarchaeum sp.]
MTSVRILSSDDVATVATPEEYVDAVRRGYVDRGNGAPAKPRMALFRDDPSGMLTTYAAILPETGAMGGYMYSAGFDADDGWFLTPVFDAESGELEAIVDGASFNPYKTGAVGAVAVDALSRNDASVVGVFGSGPQARGQLKTTATVRDLESVRVFSPTEAHRDSFAEEMDSYLSASVSAVGSPEAVLEDVDIVITATNATEPVFDGSRLPDGAHVTAMGQYHPEKRELDEVTIGRSTYVLDLRERLGQDTGSFNHALESGTVTDDHLHGELGDVLVGTVPGRTDPDDVTVFDSGGTAIETVAAAQMLFERAEEAGLGTVVEFAPGSEGLTARQV